VPGGLTRVALEGGLAGRELLARRRHQRHLGLGTIGGGRTCYLSRTADSLFWTARYIERAENTARLLEAATRLSNVGGSTEQVSNEWESAVLATGMEELLRNAMASHARTVVDFLAFSEANPSSIRSCLEAARANARSVRTAITIEMWETINAAWLELKRYRTFGQSRGELLEFLRFVKQVALSVDGIAHRTMLRTDGFSFFQLGGAIERADNTARILDVKYHVLLPAGDRVGGGLDYFQWTSILRSVSALTAYHWVYRESLKPWLIADLSDLERKDAALAGQFLWQCHAVSRQPVEDLWPPGQGPAHGPVDPQRVPQPRHRCDLPGRSARVC
jgi:uncharacterized alpha-E superfamily protein